MVNRGSRLLIPDHRPVFAPFLSTINTNPIVETLLSIASSFLLH